MRNRPGYIVLVIFALGLAFTSCEKEVGTPEDEKINPFPEDGKWNGFIIDGKQYATPNAIVEIWGENLDQLSSDFDIHLTDGSFNSKFRQVDAYSVKLYFDLNSPSLTKLSDGVYIYENTPARKPNNIVEAYIEITANNQVIKYPVLEGELKIESRNTYITASYSILTVVDRDEELINGQFTGSIQLIDQRH